MNSTGSLQIECYRNLDQLRSVLPGWEQLLAAYPYSTTFSTWEWLSAWWRNFGKNQQLLVLGFFQDGTLIGLAPLSVARQRYAGVRLRVLRFMGDGSGDSDNLDFPVLPGHEEAFAQGLLEYLAENGTGWDLIQLNTLPPNSPAASAFLNHMLRRGWRTIQKRRVASAIYLPATWDEYLACLSSEDQKNLARYGKRLEKRYRVKIYRCTQESELPRVLDAMFALHQARWEMSGESGSFANPDRRSFYYDLSRALLQRGWLELWVLELDERIASAQYAFRYRDTVFQLQEGNDPSRSSDRVGFLLRGQVIKQLIAEGAKVYDFLGGEPGYKARWGAKDNFYINIHGARPYSLGAVALVTGEMLKDGKEWLRKRLPSSSWALLQRMNLARKSKKTPPARGRTPDQPTDKQAVPLKNEWGGE